MPVKDLDHVNLRTANLAGMIAFYEKVLGLTLGPRPAFGFDGAWLYCGERATVHLIAVPQALCYCINSTVQCLACCCLGDACTLSNGINQFPLVHKYLLYGESYNSSGIDTCLNVPVNPFL